MPDENEIQTGIETGDAVPDAGELDVQAGTEELGMPSSGEDELQKTPEQEGSESEAFKKAWEDEREKRQELEQRLGFIEQQMYYANQPQQPQGQPEPDIDYNNDYPTYKDTGKMVDERVNSVFSQGRNMILDTQVRFARKEHDDFEDVVKLADEITRRDARRDGNNPTFDYIMKSNNPAETAYMIGKTHPDYEKIRQATTSKQVTKQIKSNAKKTQTLSDTGASGTTQADAAKRYENMSVEQMEDEIARVLNS